MTASNAPAVVSERRALISHRWPLRFFILLTTCIFIQLFFILRSIITLPANSSMIISRESSQDEKARELEFWVHRYLRWHKTNRHNASRVVVFSPAYSGFGDNVRGMVNMWGYAVATNRVLLIRFRSPYPLGTLVSHSTNREFIYDEKEDRKFGPLAEGKKQLGKRIEENSVSLLRGPAPVTAFRVTNSENPRDFALRTSSVSYPEKIPLFSDVVKSAITKILLAPSDELLQLKNSFLKRNGFIDNKPYLAFHARLGRGVGERYKMRFHDLKLDFISDCAADKLWQIAKTYEIESQDLRVFLATDTPDFRNIFKKAMLKRAPNSRVIYMNNRVTHFLKTHGHQAHVEMHLENILLGDAREIVAFWSGFSLVARWRGQATKLHPMYYHSCPHRDKKSYREEIKSVFQS